MTIKAGKPVVRTGLVAATAPPLTVTGSSAGGPRVWSGEGPPPPQTSDIAVGDTYVDTASGQMYRLEPGE